MTVASTIGVLLAFAAFTLAVAIGWSIAALVALLAPRIRQLPAHTRAPLLAHARLMPFGCAAVLVPLQILAFVRFESGGPEAAGPLLIGLASVGVALIVDAVRSGAASWRQTRVVVAAWRESGVPLTLPLWPHRAWSIQRRFPVVAVVGLFRPQLFVAKQVARACSAEELSAIAAHETAHVRAHDNLVRLLYRVTPGRRWAAAIADPLERAWASAAEEAADATARDATSALELASALTKVARMAANERSETMPASALIGGHELEARVRLLLAPPIDGRRHRATAWLPALALLATTVAIQATPVLATIHELFEGLVRR